MKVKTSQSFFKAQLMWYFLYLVLTQDRYVFIFITPLSLGPPPRVLLYLPVGSLIT